MSRILTYGILSVPRSLWCREPSSTSTPNVGYEYAPIDHRKNKRDKVFENGYNDILLRFPHCDGHLRLIPDVSLDAGYLDHHVVLRVIFAVRS